jgi:hypothetical protein
MFYKNTLLCPVHVSGQVIGTVKCADDCVLVPMEDTVLHVITDRPTEAGRCYGMETNVEKIYGNENLKATVPDAGYDRSKITGDCEIFQLFG